MRARQVSTSPLYPKIGFAFTDHPITVWAGAILLRLYFELIGLRAALAPLLTHSRRRRTIRFLLETCCWSSAMDWPWAPNDLSTSHATAVIRCSHAYWGSHDFRRPILCGGSFRASRIDGPQKCLKP